MYEAKFKDIRQAINFTQWNGGLLFASLDYQTIIWYAPYNKTVDEISSELDVKGFLGGYRQHEERLARITGDPNWVK